MENTWIIAILTSIIGSGAVFSFIQFLIQRKDTSLEEKISKRFDKVDSNMDDFKDEVKQLDRKIDDTAAKQARVRILRFACELQSGHKFSKEYFNQVLDDISDYKQHCETYDDFMNDRAESAIKTVRKVYDEKLAEERRGEDVFL